ncbi:gliding motility-associated ABC transporter substrate-binding protein GldG [Aureispira anguillae]|uniref:Gliding motility-associated ABC transporter substrate-binding protein GldG n=1 Tax=Aureispira anguillae TaxID=2864201 RepID=A0A915YKI7_9BACT|nr:gliding motility-associated ABC transporter substrate-binding protein GldG [Aureispira anguillae]BDS14704.1 gliding motility-associated ABC transporter substrate-binding protein GldG [Aureispira anguillae]
MQNSRFIQSLVSLLLVLGILIFLNIISSFYYSDIDLTEDKRFTLNDATYQLVEELDEVLTIEVLLEGDFPSSFKRLQNATADLLSKLRSHNSSIQIRWIDPMSGTEEENIENGKKLQKDGILPINLTKSARGGNVRKAMLAFPYAIVRYKQQMRIIPLLETTGGYNKDYTRMEAINPSINLLEYKFANAIQKLQMKSRPRMVLLTGHGELQRPWTESLEAAMFEYYDIARLNLNDVTHIDTNIHVVIVPKPTRRFPEKHLFMMDQYLMNGGKIIWLIDALNMEADSLKQAGVFMPNEHKLDINNFLFNFGVRVNPNLVLDWESSVIPVNVSPTPDNPQIESRKWFYHPKVYPYMTPLDAQATGDNTIQHPIVQNLDFVDTRYPASIDTIKTRTYIKKTPLLRSSQYTKVQFPPVRVSIDIIDKGIEQAAFNKGNQNIAVLLEGAFTSYYKNRVSAEMLEGLKQLGQPFKEQGVPSKMIVISDGDIAKNALDPTNRRKATPLPLGVNPFDGYNYGNKDFLMNCMEYMIDNKGIIAARNKEIKLRPLDQERAFIEETKWQMINMVFPILVLTIFGFLYTFARRKRFTQ